MIYNYLSIQPSSVASESAFSRAGFTITNDRAKLNEQLFAQFSCIHGLKKSNPLNGLLETE